MNVRKPSGSGDKDLVQIISQFGKDVKKFFTSSKNSEKKTINETIENSPKGVQFSDLLKIPPVQSPDHKLFFGVVYANDLAKSEFDRENPQFPVGSIIVREKNAAETSEIPVSVIAMVKREKGFSKDSGDWEFFTFNGADLKTQKRETKGDCAACHSRSEKTDWVFRDYLK